MSTTYEDRVAAGLADEQKRATAWDAEHREGPSYSDLRDLLRNAIGAKYGSGDDNWVYLEDFGDDWVVYESENETFRCSYTIDGDEVTLGDPEPVTTKTTYVPIQTNASKPRHKERRRAVPLMPEVRHFRAEGLEIREKADTNELIVTGAPIKYDVGYRVFDIFGEFEERMRPGCVSELLARGVDCRLLLNHEGLAMARTTAGTLRLWDTSTELRMEATLDARQQLANDFAIATERGDMTEMSVGMFVGRDLWGEEDGIETRDVIQLDNLLDVSGVTFAASPTTNIEIAQRMALAMPLASQARVRRIAVDLRAGKMLSDANAAKIAAAHEALNSVLEAAGLGASNDGESESTETALAQDGTRSEGGEPIRSSKASALRLQLEARSKKRKRPKLAA